MPIIVTNFDVTACKHPQTATATSLIWKVFVKVKFASEDPKEWGELRAFGGGWRRSINRTKIKTGVRKETSSQLVTPTLSRDDVPDIEDTDLLITQHYLPPWGHTQKPTEFAGQDLRLGNDQHIEIFYRQPVPGVPRSSRLKYATNRWGTTHLETYDPTFDENPSELHILQDMLDGLPLRRGLQDVERPMEINFLDGSHIIGRDEPEWSGVKADDYVEYWHQAEFQIRKPNSVQVIEKKRLFLRVMGKEPHRDYLVYHL